MTGNKDYNDLRIEKRIQPLEDNTVLGTIFYGHFPSANRFNITNIR